MQKIFRAMQRYGLIVADNGSDMYISGAFDPRWNNDMLNPAFRSLTANDFDVVELGGVARPASVPGLDRRRRSSFSQSGPIVVLVWAGAAGAQDYVIEVGSAPGLSNILVTSLGAATTISTIAPPGAYFARMRAAQWVRSRPGVQRNCRGYLTAGLRTGRYTAGRRQYPIATPSFLGSDAHEDAGVAIDHDALKAAHHPAPLGQDVSAIGQRAADVGADAALERHFAPEVAHAGGFAGLLQVHVEVHQLGHDLRVRLRLVVAPHHAERHPRPAVAEQHRRHQRVQRALVGPDFVGVPRRPD